MSTPKPRASNPLTEVAAFWRKNWQPQFPSLLDAGVGFGEPFCFRCGWLVPMPAGPKAHMGRNPWLYAQGWLERAHLHDFSGGGADDPSNIVPLCILCHRGMPDFQTSRDDAIAWVASQGHMSRHPFWQEFTDLRWGSDSWTPCPGRMVFVNKYVRWHEQHNSAINACQAAARGDRAKALELAQLADIPRSKAVEILDRYDRERAREMAVTA